MLCPDDAPVASAKAAPADGLGDAEDEGNTNGRLWRTVLIGEQEHRIDMQIIRPYLRVITHGGQSETGTVRRMSKAVCIDSNLNFVGSSLQLSPFRLLWRRPERDHCFLCLLPARQQLFRLSLHHGKPLPVSVPRLTSFSGPCSTLTCPSCSYVVSSLEMLVAEDYLIIYMNGATPRSKMPGISWLKKCYQMIDRRWGKIGCIKQLDF